MKPTDEMIEIVRDHNPAARNLVAGLTAALKDVPDVELFHFAGDPDAAVYIHSSCGTVVDVAPGGETETQVLAGECDCENTAPWFRVYVEKAEKA